jgi:hypothetical protein
MGVTCSGADRRTSAQRHRSRAGRRGRRRGCKVGCGKCRTNARTTGDRGRRRLRLSTLPTATTAAMASRFQSRMPDLWRGAGHGWFRAGADVEIPPSRDNVVGVHHLWIEEKQEMEQKAHPPRKTRLSRYRASKRRIAAAARRTRFRNRKNRRKPSSGGLRVSKEFRTRLLGFLLFSYLQIDQNRSVTPPLNCVARSCSSTGAIS